MIEAMPKEPDEPVKSVYKDLPETLLPPTFTTAELVGTYEDPAWGTLTFSEQDRDGRTVLVADRPDTTWRWEMSVFHASGDFWVARMTTLLTPKLDKEYLPAKFNRGPNGKVAELVVEWKDKESGRVLHRAVFKRRH